VETPFHRLMDAGLVDQPVFAFYLGDLINDDPTSLGYAGELTLGGTDSKYARISHYCCIVFFTHFCLHV